MPLWPLALYGAIVVALVCGMVGVSYILGQRSRNPAKAETYEGGIVGVGSARVRFSARFYLVAMFFVIFDLEAVFIFAWAIAGRELGWPGYWSLFVFVALLVAALVWLWRIGALDWYNVRRHME